MDALKIKDAIIVAHSFGGSVATPLALKYPERVRGLLFLAAASHPWPNKKTQWYYDVAVDACAGPDIHRNCRFTCGKPAD